MQFDTKNLRRLPDNFDGELKYMPTSPLILIKKTGEITFANLEKSGLVASYDEDGGDVLLFCWSGNWRSDVFVITNADLEKFYVNKATEELRIQSERSRLEQKEKRKLERKNSKGKKNG